jgi:hypothetical protein
MKLIEQLGGSYQSEAETTWLRFVLGDQFHNVTLANLADCDDPEAYLEAISRLPRVRVIVVGGETFADPHVARLAQVGTLEGLVLDTTAVTDAKIAELRQERPGLQIYKSQRRLCQQPVWSSSRFNRTSHPDLWKLLGDEYFREVESGVLRGDVTHPSQLLALLCRHVSALDDLQLECGISDDCLSHLRRLSRLRRLFVRRADGISDEGLKHLSGLVSLERLEVPGAGVTDAGMMHLEGMTNLGKLDLSRTSVGDDGLAALNVLANLYGLTLDQTRVSDTGLSHIAALKNVDLLSLSGTSITDAGLIHLREMPQLINLDISRTEISNEGLAHLSEMKNLLVLRLSGTSIDGAGLERLKSLTRLQHLGLSDTQITDQGLAHLKQMPTLKVLALKRCQLTQAAIDDLQAALPQCRIEN